MDARGQHVTVYAYIHMCVYMRTWTYFYIYIHAKIYLYSYTHMCQSKGGTCVVQIKIGGIRFRGYVAGAGRKSALPLL